MSTSAPGTGERKDSKMAQDTGSTPQCNEYFHDPNAGPGELRLCMGRYHEHTYYVCGTCIKTSASWTLRPDRRFPTLTPTKILREKLYKALCLRCTATTIKRLGARAVGCHCANGWFCFECRDVIGWRGHVEAMDITDRTDTGHGDTRLCPGCEVFFHLGDIDAHALLCLACKGILLEGTEEEETTGAKWTTPYPPLQSPNWMGHPRLRKEGQYEADEEIAPDTLLATPSLRAGHYAGVSNNTPITVISYHMIPEWEFPRCPTVRTVRPTPNANPTAHEDTSVQRILLAYVEADNERCWVCGDRQHETWACTELAFGDTPGARLMMRALETRSA